ncbi:hypothetical protein N9D08_01455 [bacterium]|nr:hypothetical protein [bacterium]
MHKTEPFRNATTGRTPGTRAREAAVRRLENATSTRLMTIYHTTYTFVSEHSCGLPFSLV